MVRRVVNPRERYVATMLGRSAILKWVVDGTEPSSPAAVFGTQDELRTFLLAMPDAEFAGLLRACGLRDEAISFEVELMAKRLAPNLEKLGETFSLLDRSARQAARALIDLAFTRAPYGSGLNVAARIAWLRRVRRWRCARRLHVPSRGRFGR